MKPRRFMVDPIMLALFGPRWGLLPGEVVAVLPDGERFLMSDWREYPLFFYLEQATVPWQQPDVE
jgi:hypothetical protein